MHRKVTASSERKSDQTSSIQMFSYSLFSSKILKRKTMQLRHSQRTNRNSNNFVKLKYCAIVQYVLQANNLVTLTAMDCKDQMDLLKCFDDNADCNADADPSGEQSDVMIADSDELAEKKLKAVEEEEAKQAALEALSKGQKLPNEDKILAELDIELAAFMEEHKNRVGPIPLEPELINSIEEYIAELKAEVASRPPVKLEEDPRKYERNAGNDPSFVNIPVYDPNDPKYRDIAATIQRHIEEAEKLKKSAK